MLLSSTDDAELLHPEEGPLSLIAETFKADSRAIEALQIYIELKIKKIQQDSYVTITAKCTVEATLTRKSD